MNSNKIKVSKEPNWSLILQYRSSRHFYEKSLCRNAVKKDKLL